MPLLRRGYARIRTIYNLDFDILSSGPPAVYLHLGALLLSRLLYFFVVGIRPYPEISAEGFVSSVSKEDRPLSPDYGHAVGKEARHPDN
ncbi:uncharacterized protein F4812DRAFT_453984 [Daldinia caldariorum]|uniref:uncharacterized protein n=1 Tax=Daldinia caldariorum TaxID=326644 RepID=UPI002008A5B6|nr:uncharacterized protein F4812DRAFT_453984 [Daldinia caldariorum]KAI1472170.1 hypothetical protein F4812DRAFT_453984 [Daldinia caldariorum]